jgi:hypothetical protein
MAMSKCSKSSVALPPSMHKNPPSPLPLFSKVNNMDKVDGPDAEKTEPIKWSSSRILTSHPPSTPDAFYLQGWMPRGMDQVVDVF